MVNNIIFLKGVNPIRNFAVKSALLTLLFSMIALPHLPAPAVTAAAGETDTGLPVRTVQDVAGMWRTHMNPQADINRPYVTAPSVSLPYTAGKLSDDYLRDGLNAVNFYRFISGLPADVSMTEELNVKAAHGSVLLASEGNFGHKPPQPADMPKDFFDKGFASTSTANIFASFGYNNHILFSSIEAYMEDSDVSNLSVLGHRRWILNPPLKEVGMGLAKGADEFTYSALQVFDKSRPEFVDFEYIPYPARGAFPIEVFTPTTAWSVSLNRTKYEKPSAENVTVTLKRLRDNKTWRFSSGINPVTEQGAYFNVETNNYGTGPAVIFRPDGVGEYRAGDRFQVVIEGLQGKDGSSQSITYTVDFMSAKNPDLPKFSDISRHWGRQTIDWAYDRGIASGFPNGTFLPDDEVTEAQFLKMFTVGAGLEVTPSVRWFDAYYAVATERGFTLSGLTNANAKARPLNRTAVAELFASAAGKELSGDEAIRYMLDNGYSKGKTAATVQGYRGSDTLTRAEAVQFIKNALDASYTLPAADAKLFL